MEIDYIYEHDDYLVINRTQRLKRKYSSLRNFMAFAFAGACLLAALFYSYKTLVFGEVHHWLAIIFFILFFVLLFFIFVFDDWNAGFYAEKQGLLGKPMKMELTPEFIGLKMNHISNKFDWLGVVGIDEVSSHFLLWINKSQAIVVPKRAFKNDEEIDNVRRYLSNNYNGEVISLV